MLIRLKDDLWVNPREVASVHIIDRHTSVVIVEMVGGTTHAIESDYGKSTYDTMLRILKVINGAEG